MLESLKFQRGTGKVGGLTAGLRTAIGAKCTDPISRVLHGRINIACIVFEGRQILNVSIAALGQIAQDSLILTAKWSIARKRFPTRLMIGSGICCLTTRISTAGRKPQKCRMPIVLPQKNKKGCYASPQPQETPWLEWLNRRQSFYANPSVKEKWTNPKIAITDSNLEQELYPYDVFKSLHDLVKEKYGPFKDDIETRGSKNGGDAAIPLIAGWYTRPGLEEIWRDQSKIKKQYEANSCLGPRPSDSCVSNTAYCWGGRLPKVWKKCGPVSEGGSDSVDCGTWNTKLPSRRRYTETRRRREFVYHGEKELAIKDDWRLDNPAGTYDKHTFKGVTIPQGGSCIDVMSDYEVCYVAPVMMNKGKDTDDGWSWITLGYDVRAGCFTQETGNPFLEAYLQDPIRNAMKATNEPARRLFMQRYTFWCMYAGWKNNKQQEIARSGNNYGRASGLDCDFGNVDMSKTTDIAVDFSPINDVA